MRRRKTPMAFPALRELDERSVLVVIRDRPALAVALDEHSNSSPLTGALGLTGVAVVASAAFYAMAVAYLAMAGVRVSMLWVPGGLGLVALFINRMLVEIPAERDRAARARRFGDLVDQRSTSGRLKPAGRDIVAVVEWLVVGDRIPSMIRSGLTFEDAISTAARDRLVDTASTEDRNAQANPEPGSASERTASMVDLQQDRPAETNLPPTTPGSLRGRPFEIRLDAALAVLADEHSREQSLTTRGVAIGTAATALAALLGPTLSGIVSFPATELGHVALVFNAALVVGLAAITVAIAVLGVMRPASRQSIGIGMLRRWLQDDRLTDSEATARGEILKATVTAIESRRNVNKAKAKALTWAYGTFLAELLIAVPALVTLGFS